MNRRSTHMNSSTRFAVPQKRKAFMPFVTAGDPDLAATAALVARAGRAAAPASIEIGFPYSDPIADGPRHPGVVHPRPGAAACSIDDIFALRPRSCRRAELRADAAGRHGLLQPGPSPRAGDVPASRRRTPGFSGAIVPDLPIEEAEDARRPGRRPRFQADSPGHADDAARARRAASPSSRRVSSTVVSVTGITGERDRLPPELLDQLAWLRQQTELPLCVGFGISKPEQVGTLREAADGIIVGSAFVRGVEQAANRPLSEVVADVGTLAESLVAALNP